jgi:hypothetical protein
VAQSSHPDIATQADYAWGCTSRTQRIFHNELVQTCAKENDLFLVGGDFSIVRSPQEKNNERYDKWWPFLFNAIIDSLDLRELDLSNKKFTWENYWETPTYES